MRLQRLSTVWRYIGFFALIVYFFSFGTFLSRMISLNPNESVMRVAVSMETSEMERSTRVFFQAPDADVGRSTVQAPHPGAKSLASEAPALDAKSSTKNANPVSLLEKLINPVNSSSPTPLTQSHSHHAARPEVDDQPEVTLLRMFERQRNATLLKSNASKSASRLTLSSWTNSRIANTSGGKVVNPHPFKYVINCETQCLTAKAPPYLLVYVHTAPGHYKRRMVIRQTWGDGRQYPVDIRVVFFTGNPASSGVQKALFFEAEQYGDIVQEDFLDTYRNLTYKGVAALKWISSYCSQATFILKTDDDIFVNMFTLLSHLRHIVNQRNGTGAVRNLLMCLVWQGMTVMRSGKWMVTKEEWKEDTYPTYCSGCAFVMSTDVAIALHEVSYFVPFFWVDDFYITGLLPQKLGTITHTQFMSSYVLDGNKLEEKFTGVQWYQYIFSHVHNLDIIQAVWRKVVAIHKGEVVPKIQFLVPTNSTASRQG